VNFYLQGGLQVTGGPVLAHAWTAATPLPNDLQTQASTCMEINERMFGFADEVQEDYSEEEHVSDALLLLYARGTAPMKQKGAVAETSFRSKTDAQSAAHSTGTITFSTTQSHPTNKKKKKKNKRKKAVEVKTGTKTGTRPAVFSLANLRDVILDDQKRLTALLAKDRETYARSVSGATRDETDIFDV
jgi:hypothetical protein